MATANNIDKSAIDQLIHQFFGIFNNKNKATPDSERIYECCLPEARILIKSGATLTMYSLTDFIEPRKAILTDGTLTEFEEWETDEQTTIVNTIAQRVSRYQKKGLLKGAEYSGTGTKLFHLVHTGKGCKLVFSPGRMIDPVHAVSFASRHSGQSCSSCGGNSPGRFRAGFS